MFHRNSIIHPLSIKDVIAVKRAFAVCTHPHNNVDASEKTNEETAQFSISRKCMHFTKNFDANRLKIGAKSDVSTTRKY